MFRAAAIGVALLSAVCVLPVCAQEATDTHLAAALELIDASNVKASMLTLIDTLVPLMLDQIRAQRPNVNAAVLQEFGAAVHEEVLILARRARNAGSTDQAPQTKP